MFLVLYYYTHRSKEDLFCFNFSVEDRTPSLLKVSLKPMESSKCEMFYTSELIRGLSSGLHENHLCAVDEEMDTCEVSRYIHMMRIYE